PRKKSGRAKVPLHPATTIYIYLPIFPRNFIYSAPFHSENPRFSPQNSPKTRQSRKKLYQFNTLSTFRSRFGENFPSHTRRNDLHVFPCKPTSNVLQKQ